MNRIPITKRSKHKGNSGLLGDDQRVRRTARFFIWVLALSIISVLAVSTVAVGQITVSGTQAQRNKIASWLTKSLGTTVTVDANGTLSVAAGGNASATRLRNMANDPNVSVTLDVVDKDPNVVFGAWNAEDANDKTTGTQTIDVNDLEAIGNVLNSYGFTPDMVLMHEVAEVYEGQKHHDDCWDYSRAHASGIAAENELMGEHSTSMVARFPRGDANYPSGTFLMKIRRPDGSHVVVVIDPYAADPNKLVQWYRERVDCNSVSGLIAIADPDPQVHIFSYDFDGNHTISGTWDTVDSHPTGVAFAPSGNLYVTENLAGPDEIRIFDTCGVHTGTIVGPELISPEGIDVDQQTGDVFVAVAGGVLRYDSNSDLVGLYSTGDASFAPTDVAVWRNDSLRVQCRYAQSEVYALFVTDRATNQVYHFDVEDDMGGPSYSLAFGGEYLSSPEGLTIGAHGAVWVASTGNDRIYRFSPSGNLIRQDGSDYFVEDGSRNFFDLVMVDGDGIYVVDETPLQGAILLYDFEAELVATLGEGEVQCPRAIAAQFRVNWDNLLPLDLAVYASNPRPLDSETDVERDPVLSWSPGKYAGSH
ncbi:MAG: NHL repeat-containing protein, partial [Planctomycetota bacterium]